jgi:ABC-type multidrug transport system permease subunit
VDATIEMTMGMMEAIGASGDTAAMDRAAEQARNSYTLSGIAMGYLWGIIWYAIIAAIVGLITKKKNKELDF